MTSQASQRQQRGFERRPSNAAVYLVALDPSATAHQPVPATICDISPGGCRIQTASALDKGSLWSVRFGHEKDSRTATALVRWSGVIGTGAFQAGAQFLADPEILTRAGVSIDDLLRPPGIDGPDAAPWQPHFGINAPESLVLRTIDSASLSVGRDLYVAESLSGCTIDIAGRLDAQNACVSGGRIHVMGEARIGELGSPAGLATSITVGRSLSACLMLAMVPAAIAERDRDIKTLEEGVAEVHNDHAASSQEKEQITLWLFEIEEKRKQNARMLANADVIRSKGTPRSRIRLTIVKRVHAGVTICMGDSCTRLSRAIDGPVTFTLGDDGRLLCHRGDAAIPIPSTEPLHKAA